MNFGRRYRVATPESGAFNIFGKDLGFDSLEMQKRAVVSALFLRVAISL